MPVKIKKYSAIFVALAVCVSTAMVFSATNALAQDYCQAQVKDISGGKYFPAVKEAIDNAQKSIAVAMFSAQPNPLVEALIAAKKRNVDVEVILDQNTDFLKNMQGAEMKSSRVYERLKEAGIKVNYDEPARYTHAKVIVIDRKIVILGSANWTEASFNSNIETNVLINSEKLAEEILSYLKTIKLGGKIDEDIQPVGPAVTISQEFLASPKLAPLMVKKQAERAFDIYLYLLWKKPAMLNYDELAKYLGIYAGWNAADYRRQIIKVLRKLEREYGLIKFEPHFAGEGTVRLIEIASEPRNDVKLTQDYFAFGWDRQLSLSAKFCYLINLVCYEDSDKKPYWSKSVAAITTQFGGISPSVIYAGMGELRRKKLLEVGYDDLTGKPYAERRPNIYKPLKLYDPQKRKAELKSIKNKYGREDYAQARKYAQIVFEENNPEVIEDIILKTKEYGAGEIKRAFGEIAKKSVDNPKRNYLYLTRILGR